MARLSIYVPDQLAGKLKTAAREQGVPLSRYIASQLTAAHADDWPAGYFENACGFLKGDFPAIDALPAEPVAELPY